MEQKVVILGAGLAGLSTAYHLQNGCCVYEQDEQIGGLASSKKIDGFVFDCDGHLFHFRTKYVRRLIDELLPGVLVAHKRNAWIFSHDVYTRYPFQANTFGLPPEIIKKCILGILRVKSEDKKKENANLKDWMLEKFGPGITKHFMYSYNLKFWTVPPEELIPDWTQDIVPLVGLKDVINGAFSFKTKPLGYNSRFWYPRKGGINQLPLTLAKRINNIKTSHKTKTIDLKKKKVYFENKKSADFTHLVCTLPMAELPNLIVNKIPAKVKQAFNSLKYISIFNLNLGIDRENIRDKHWIYFPEDKFCFFRVGFPMNFSKDVVPPGKSSLYAELSYSEFRPLNEKEAEARICKDLIAAGILRQDDRILTRHVNNIKYAYILYDHNYWQNIKLINEFLLSNNIYPAGRFGRWKYMSMEDAILDGKLISNLIDKK